MKLFSTKIIVLLLCLLSLVANAQILRLQPRPIPCYTTEVLDATRKANPSIESDAHFEAWMGSLINEKKYLNVPVQNYGLPIVFHIINNNGEAVGTTPNISQSLVQQQVLQANKDYANLSNSPYTVALNSGIQFQLATTDPNGNALTEPGIERINRNSKGWTDPGTTGWTFSYITNTIKPGSIWDPSKYINIWVVSGISGGSAGSIILGYATFPGSSTLDGLNNSETDTTAGVTIIASTVGSIFLPSSCASSYGIGRTLTHELGHFFGLRHIWGDANCGNDYVDDTPIHLTSNSGLPMHPKPNSCGTTDEMFENYMDYTDGKLQNTFTAGQVDRMQVVMLNSPRRASLVTSSVGKVAVTASNKISFADCSGSITVPETGIAGTSSRYRDIPLYLLTEDAATGSATVSISATGTAINGTHYQLSTSSVSFANGDKMKPITVRIFDNALIDGDRTIILSYSIAGTGVTAGSSAQTYTINIYDDDNIVIGQNTINLLNENFETAGGAIPTGWSSLLSSNYPSPFTVGANGDAGGSAQCAYVSNTYATTKTNTYSIGTAGVAVLQSPVIDPNSVQSVGSLSFKYKVWGSVNDNTSLYYSYSPTDGFYHGWGNANAGPYYGNGATVSATPSLALPTTITNRKFAIVYYWTTTTATTGGNPGFNVDDVLLPATPYSIETIVANSYGYDVPVSTANNIFRSTNSRVIATVSSANVAVSGVMASITEAGTDRPTISTNNTTYLRTRKVIKLTPTTINTSTKYTAKFYFTSGEISAWGTAINNVKIIKVADGTSISDILTTANSVIVNPIIDDKLSTDGYIAFSGTFTGFGTFALVENATILPVNLIDFIGVLESNKVKLQWATASEYNNSGFTVQRSTDGSNFTDIGWVAGLNIATGSSYSYYDANIAKGNKYYYRLKQVDTDGKFTISKVVTVFYSGSNSIVSIYPNPVTDNLVIQNNSLVQNTDIIIIDAAGKIIYQKQVLLNSKVNLSTTSWNAGVYIIKIQTDEGLSTFKVVKN